MKPEIDQSQSPFALPELGDVMPAGHVANSEGSASEVPFPKFVGFARPVEPKPAEAANASASGVSFDGAPQVPEALTLDEVIEERMGEWCIDATYDGVVIE